MKQTAYSWLPLAILPALLLRTSVSIAQQANEDSVMQEACAEVATALGIRSSEISFEGLKLVQDKLGMLVCGVANGKRFLAGPAGKPPPQIEGALSASMFNYLWNARCQGMSASAAAEAFRHGLK
ncbi:MAG: hypothetical protein IH605_18395 [Burkholderiales bacterium]|nr:hypothetical protein [Burkholderiales bacterium]